MVTTKAHPRRTDAVPVVAAEIPVASIPRNILPVLMWVLGTAVAVSALWVSISVISDRSAAAQKEHDARFMTKAEGEKHEREDIQAIMALTEAINGLATSAAVSRQRLIASNKQIESSVADLVSRQCRKDNANAKDVGMVCEKEIRAAEQTAIELRQLREKANEAANAAQTRLIDPPIAKSTGPTK